MNKRKAMQMTEAKRRNFTNRRTVTDEVVDYIGNKIRSDVYQTGDKLPNEDELAKEIGVGRSSVREGMKVLKVYGVVEIRQGGGTYVSDRAGEHMFDFLWLMSGSTYENFVDFRRTIEIGNIAVVCGKLNKTDINEMQRLIDLIDYKNSLDIIVQADRDFHRKLSGFVNNPVQMQIEKMMYQIRMDTLYKTLCFEEDVIKTNREHQRILDAIKNSDLDECINAIMNHLDSANINIKERSK